MLINNNAAEAMEHSRESTDRMVVELDQFSAFSRADVDALDGADASSRSDLGVIERVRSGTRTCEEDELQYDGSRPAAVVDSSHTVASADACDVEAVAEVAAAHHNPTRHLHLFHPPPPTTACMRG